MPTENDKNQHFHYIVGTIGLGMFSTSLDMSMINIALFTIAKDFKLGLDEVRWVLLAYIIFYTVLLLPMGILGDFIGRKRLFLFGITIFTIGAFACSLAPTIEVLLICRIIQIRFLPLLFWR